MKKVYALLLTVVLAIGMTLPTLAADSPNTKSAALEKTAPAKAITTSIKEGKVEQLPADVKKAVADVVANTENLTNLGVPTEAKLVSSFDFSYPADKIPAEGIQVPFKVSNAKAGDKAIILHRMDNVTGKPWEKVGEAILGSDLTVVGTFHGTSPVAIMIVDAAAVEATGVKAPKTGEF